MRGILLVLLICFGVSGFCAPQDNAQPPAVAVANDASAWRGESYRLTSKDIVKITVFQEEDLATSGRIASDGTISCPLIGPARIGGKTAQEAAQFLQGLYLKYLKKPQVTVSILEYAKRRFTILGQVMKPGTLDMPDDSTLNLTEAVGLAGGYTRIAAPDKITLKRIINGQETVIRLNGQKMLTDGSAKRFEVLPGDTIFVGEGWF